MIGAGEVCSKRFSLHFSLSRKKQSSISSFVSTGVYPHNWNLDLRRNLIVGEIDEVIRLLDILDGVRLVPSRLDKRRWKLDHSGLFSCHSFCSFIPKDDYKKDFSPYQRLKFFYGRLLVGESTHVTYGRGTVPLCVYLPIGVLSVSLMVKLWTICSSTALMLLRCGGCCWGKLMLFGLHLKVVSSCYRAR